MGRKKWALLASTAMLALSLAACNNSSKSSSGGTPQKGGTLTMLGTGDVDYMDPNISYYTTGYLGLRMWARQLLTYPAIEGQQTNVVADLATQVPSTSNGGITDNYQTFTLTIKTGAMWNTNPPRQVTAADAVRGIERTCNPVQPFGGLPDFETLIVGMQTFCSNFAKVKGTVEAIQQFLSTNSISGLTVSSSNPETVIYHLTRSATYFVNQLAMPAFSPAPVEFLNYLPASAQLAQHTLSDGPYEIQSYDPAKTLVFVRNSAWNASTDSVRKAYVDKIDVSMTGNGQSIQQQISTNTPAADMGWDTPVPTAAIPNLLATKNPNLILGATYGTFPYVVFNEVSPNNQAVMTKLAFRQALEYGINRTNLIQDDGGPIVSPPLTHVLPPGIVGSQNLNPYPFNTTKAEQLLASATGGHHVTLTLIYQAGLQFEASMFQTLQADLGKIGITVKGEGIPNADFFTKYLEVPSVAHAGTWDIALTGWYPDWYGNGGLSFFNPLFSGPPSYPPSGSNFGFYNSSATNGLITQGEHATSLSQTASVWAQADAQVMADAPIFPITSPTMPVFHGTQVRSTIFVPNLNQIDPTNVWLTPSQNGGG
jgi:peptide/nickel transport system substrate-binding protein